MSAPEDLQSEYQAFVENVAQGYYSESDASWRLTECVDMARALLAGTDWRELEMTSEQITAYKAAD